MLWLRRAASELLTGQRAAAACAARAMAPAASAALLQVCGYAKGGTAADDEVPPEVMIRCSSRTARPSLPVAGGRLFAPLPPSLASPAHLPAAPRPACAMPCPRNRSSRCSRSVCP